MSMKTRIFLVMLGFVVLCVGVALYLVDRPPEDTYFVYRSLKGLSFHGDVPALFGMLGNFLPGFVHPFSFSLITAGILAPERRGKIAICLFWLATNALFEAGQHFKDFASSLVPGWFDGIPYLENTAGFFIHGSFDWCDIAAIVSGSCLALFILITLDRMNRASPHC
ncbi:MAG: hypothetical protein WCY59_04455 [Anaerovoracaceae bacterium]